MYLQSKGRGRKIKVKTKRINWSTVSQLRSLHQNSIWDLEKKIRNETNLLMHKGNVKHILYLPPRGINLDTWRIFLSSSHCTCTAIKTKLLCWSTELELYPILISDGTKKKYTKRKGPRSRFVAERFRKYDYYVSVTSLILSIALSLISEAAKYWSSSAGVLQWAVKTVERGGKKSESAPRWGKGTKINSLPH